MIVQEVSGGMGVTCWNTKTVYPATSAFPGYVSEWCYCHPHGADYILFAMRRQDDRTWSPARPMSTEKWKVAGSNAAGARQLMYAFFTEAGYVRQEEGR